MAFIDGIADFRSDTVTRPTPEMRRAMAEAEVGDDVYGEDPTVNALEEESAAAVGKPAAVFVPTGSMGNQLAIGTLTRPGDEVLCVEAAHVRNYEVAAAAAVSGVQFRTLPGPGGQMTATEVGTAIDQSHHHMPRITMLVWENTHNVSGGTVVPYEMMVASTAVARLGGLSVHIDGARIFNAVAATGISAEDFAAVADTIQFCFSKGLGAPVGSILCGSKEVIDEARYMRKRLGGGMRQVGVVAAPARVALRDRDRVAEDHKVARRLADGIGDRYPEAVDLARVETNMVVVDARAFPFPVAELVDRLNKQGVIIGTLGPHLIR
ncbi:MAG: threonine aldolase family protein, partial [Acidimicrobiia bacterium]|nr:threonine aldolase family protein [Acidimicrobiia bacterium]